MSRGRRNKGNRPQSKDFQKEEKFEESFEENVQDQKGRPFTKDVNNDPSWYNKYPELVRDVSKVVFGRPLGSELNWEAWPANYVNESFAPATVAGVMHMWYIPTIGNASKPTDPVNVASNAMYSFVRTNISGRRNYDNVDMMLYVVAVEQCFMYYASLVRAYGIIRNYHYLNRYTPKFLLNAMGFDGVDLESNMANFRAYINTYAAKLGAFIIPSGISFVERQVWLTTNIYKDSNTAKAQAYIWSPAYLYKWKEGSGETQTKLSPIATPWRTGNATLGQLISYGNDLLETLLGSGDAQTIAGDILKAYGSPNVITVSAITEGYETLSTWNAEVQSQIENAVFVGAENINLGDITVNNSNLVTGPYIQNALTFLAASGVDRPGAQLLKRNPLINFHHEDPTSDELMVATRMAPVLKQDAGVMTLHFGTEVPLDFTMFWLDPDQTVTGYSSVSMYSGHCITNEITSSPSDFRAQVRALGQLSSFDWHPTVYVGASINSAEGVFTVYDLGAFVDYDNYAVTNRQVLADMHDAAVLSEFAFPETLLDK